MFEPYPQPGFYMFPFLVSNIILQIFRNYRNTPKIPIGNAANLAFFFEISMESQPLAKSKWNPADFPKFFHCIPALSGRGAARGLAQRPLAWRSGAGPSGQRHRGGANLRFSTSQFKYLVEFYS